MKKSKLIEGLRTLSKKELMRFEQYLQSPYFHRPKVTEEEWRLLVLLKSHFPDFNSEALTKMKVFAQLFPQKQYVVGQVEKKMTALYKRLEQFIYQESIAQADSDFDQQLAVAKFYRERSHPNLYRKQLSRLEKILATERKKGEKEYWKDYQLQLERSHFEALYQPKKSNLNLVDVHQTLDSFYIITKLGHVCSSLFQDRNNNEFDLEQILLFYKRIIPLTEQKTFSQIPLVQIYNLVFKIHQQDEADDLQLADGEALEAILELYQDELPLVYLQAFSGFLRSTYIKLELKEGHGLSPKTFKLYQDHLEKGYLDFEGGLRPVVLSNIIKLGLEVGAYDWVHQFLMKYAKAVRGTFYPESIYRLCWANYYFYTKNYQDAKEHLVEDYDHYAYQCTAKRLDTMIAYEEDSPLLEAKMEAFRLYLHRLSAKSYPQFLVDRNKRFLAILRQILTLRPYDDPAKVERIRKKALKKPIILSLDWLQAKLEEKRLR